jgi:hypothetical protein
MCNTGNCQFEKTTSRSYPDTVCVKPKGQKCPFVAEEDETMDYDSEDEWYED